MCLGYRNLSRYQMLVKEGSPDGAGFQEKRLDFWLQTERSDSGNNQILMNFLFSSANQCEEVL
jgi:hypothetical protein